MAISNAVGSNVFDILLCLGLPWLLQTTVGEAKDGIKVYSAGMCNVYTYVCIREDLSWDLGSKLETEMASIHTQMYDFIHVSMIRFTFLLQNEQHMTI